MPHDHSHDGNDPCAHAQHHAARARTAMAKAQAWCAASGLKLTPIRRQVLEALYTTHRAMSAYDLIDLAARGGEKRLAPVTIYRALDFLIAHGFAHRLESRNAFIACPFQHQPEEPVVFLICERCGGVDEAECAELGRALKALADREGFAPSARVIELAGACSHCRADATAP
jgi:Fur family transcriptional regulator, zinc uptake regulator